MKRIICFWLLTAVVGLCASAGDRFVAKPFSVYGLGETIDRSIYLNIPDLFEFPDDIALTENLDNHGVTVTVSSDNEELVSYKTYSWYLRYNRITLTQHKNLLGTANVTVSLTYNGETVENTVPYEYVEVIAKPLTMYADLGASKKLDVLSGVSSRGNQQNVTRTGAENTVSLTLLEEPALGTCTIDTIHYDKMNTGYYRSAVVYTPVAGLENYSRDRFRYRITLASGNYADAEIEVLIRKNALVSRIIEFMPAPGQFTNEGTYVDPSCIIGNGSGSGTNAAPQTTGLVSLGGFGGYVIVGFVQPVYNDPQHPYGVDFTIGGNAFVADYKGVWTEPGGVMVSRDDNGNGEADDEWYELAGSDYWFSTSHRNITMTYYDPAYNKRYTVPWTTDNGMAGALLTNQFHQQPYFPDPALYPAVAKNMKDGTLSYTGTLIRSSLDKRVPSYIEFYRCPAFGYCDNKTKQNGDLTVATNPYYDDENGRSSDGFDISWAVDKNGNYVDLDHIDFVKIYTAGSVNAGWLGEWSTEVTGVGITNPDPDYVAKDYYLNYASITQLQVPVGGSCQYEGLAFKNGKPIKEGEPRWWVDDESVGTIDNTGLFTGKSIGTTMIHFQQYPDAPADEFDVEVVAMTGVMIDIEGNASTVSNDSISCVLGEKIYINVESLTQNKDQLNGTTSNRYIYDNYSWDNSNPAVGTIDNGTFEALSEGETMLTVYSGVDPSLSSQIKVTVVPIPEAQLISDPIRIPYYQASGQLTNDKIFTTGNDARVDMKAIRTAIDGNVSLANNVVDYDFESLDFGRYPVEFSTSAYGVGKEFSTAFDYYADDYATPRQLIVLSDAEVYGITADGGGINEYDLQLADGDADDVVAQGAYVWIAKGNRLSRYNLAKGKKVAEAVLSTDGPHAFAIYEDRILVTDGEKVRRYYKTDLEACGEFSAGMAAEAIATDGTSVWISGDGKIAQFSLAGFMEQSTMELPVAGGTRLYATGGKVYQPSAAGDAMAMIVAGEDGVSTVACGDAVSSGVSFLDADAGAVVAFDSEHGVRVFDVATGLWSVKAVGYDNIPDLGTALKADPASMALMAAVEPNVAPVAKSISATSIYEYATAVTNSTKLKTSFCSDQENNYDVYARIGEGSEDWLQSVERQANGSLKVVAKAAMTVDADSVVSFRAEIIDHAGESVFTEVPFKIVPRIYRPLIRDYSIDGVAETDFEHSAPIGDIFVSQGSATIIKNYYLYTDEIVRHSLPENVNVAISGDELRVSAPAGTEATGEIVLQRTIAYKNQASYTPKVFSTVIPVTISASTQGIDEVGVRTVGFYPNPATDHIVIDVESQAAVEIYTLSGARVLMTEAMPGAPVNVSNLPSGTYILRVGDGRNWLTGKLIKR